MADWLSFEKRRKLIEAVVLGKSRGTVKKSFEGIYILIVQVSSDIKVNIGAVGERAFEKGLYAYVGSAQTNMEQRVKRHLRIEKSKFWHIDYLLDNPAAKIIEVFFKEGDKAEECKTAKSLSKKNKPIASFGCSDCNCKSHLFYMENYRFLKETMQVFPKET